VELDLTTLFFAVVYKISMTDVGGPSLLLISSNFTKSRSTLALYRGAAVLRYGAPFEEDLHHCLSSASDVTDA